MKKKYILIKNTKNKFLLYLFFCHDKKITLNFLYSIKSRLLILNFKKLKSINVKNFIRFILSLTFSSSNNKLHYILIIILFILIY